MKFVVERQTDRRPTIIATHRNAIAAKRLIHTTMTTNIFLRRIIRLYNLEQTNKLVKTESKTYINFTLYIKELRVPR